MMNNFKYKSCGHPTMNKPEYQTSSARAHRLSVSSERHFVSNKNHILCNELKNSACNDYRPKSESSKEFSWKINSSRYHREELAPVSSSIRYIHRFSNQVTPSDKCKTVSDCSLPRTLFTTESISKPKIVHSCKETHFTNTEGYFPLADPLVSTTEIDYRLHSNYATARTNNIVRKESPFNSDAALFTLKSKLINDYPMRDRYRNLNLRDDSKFSQPSFDRIVPNRMQFVKYFGMSSEMSSNY